MIFPNFRTELWHLKHPHIPYSNSTTKSRVNEGNTPNKWIKLQTACVEHLFIIYSCIAHVEHVGQDLVAAEEEETEVVCQEQEQQQHVESDQAEEQYLDTDFANPDLQQGKLRFIDPI